ncbi:MAG: AAA family ATPase [Balneolales bacterium]
MVLSPEFLNVRLNFLSLLQFPVPGWLIFDTAPIHPPFTIDKFVKAIEEAVKLDYEVVILDSASHFWEGILEYKDMLDKRGGNSFTNWAAANKHYKIILDTLLQSDVHLIACLRSKTEYIVEKDTKGRSVPKKIGMAPIMRDGVEYEFTTVFNLDAAHQAMADKDRTGLFTDKIFQITESTGQELSKCLKGGIDQDQTIKAEFEALGNQLYNYGWGNKKKELIRYVANGQHNSESLLTDSQYKRLISGMKRKLEPELNGEV